MLHASRPQQGGRPASDSGTPRATNITLSRREAGLLFAIALCLRMLYLWSIHDAAFFDRLQTEPLRYLEWAQRILGAGPAPRPPFEQAPGYPYFVAGVFALFGPSVAAVALVQAVLDSIAVVLLALLSARLFDRPVGLLAGAVAAAYGPFLYFTGELLPATLFVFLLLASLLLSLHSRWLAAGCGWALCLLVRSELLLALPWFALDALFRGGPKAVMRSLAPLALVLVGLLAINGMHEGRPVLLTTSSGLNLWLGNNPHSDGVNPFSFGSLAVKLTQITDSTPDPALSDRLFRNEAISFWTTEPTAAASLLWKKLVWTLGARELPNSSEIEWQTGHSWLYHAPLFPFGWGLVLPLAFCALPALRGRVRALLLLFGLLGIGFGTCLLFFTNARFRLPAAPALTTLAAVGAVHCARAIRSWRSRAQQPPAERRASIHNLLVSTLLLALGSLATWHNLYGLRGYRIPELAVNTGILEREAGNFGAAVLHLREGLRTRPEDTVASIHLALALEQAGSVLEATRAYLDALLIDRHNVALLEMVDKFGVRQGIDQSFFELYSNATDETVRSDLWRQLVAEFQSPAP